MQPAGAGARNVRPVIHRSQAASRERRRDRRGRRLPGARVRAATTQHPVVSTRVERLLERGVCWTARAAAPGGCSRAPARRTRGRPRAAGRAAARLDRALRPEPRSRSRPAPRTPSTTKCPLRCSRASWRAPQAQLGSWALGARRSTRATGDAARASRARSSRAASCSSACSRTRPAAARSRPTATATDGAALLHRGRIAGGRAAAALQDHSRSRHLARVGHARCEGRRRRGCATCRDAADRGRHGLAAPIASGLRTLSTIASVSRPVVPPRNDRVGR